MQPDELLVRFRDVPDDRLRLFKGAAEPDEMDVTFQQLVDGAYGDDPTAIAETAEATWDAAKDRMLKEAPVSKPGRTLRAAGFNEFGVAKALIDSRKKRDEVAEKATAEESIGTLHELATFYSVSLVSNLLTHIGSDVFTNPDHNPRVVRLQVHQAVGDTSKRIAKMMEPNATQVEIDGIQYGQNYRHKQLKVLTADGETVYEKQSRHKSEQLEDGEFAADLTTSLQEVDLFFALLEWTLQRNLSYIPIMAPRSMEDGPYTEGRNPHADILLLGLGNNDIVPVQHKQFSPERFKLDTRIGEYIPEMMFITARDIARPILEAAIIVFDDLETPAQTGYNVASTYGEITSNWIQYRGAAKGRQTKPKRALNEKLGHVFARLDTDFLPILEPTVY